MRNRSGLAVNGLGRFDTPLDALFGQLFGEGAETKRAARPTGEPLPLSLWSDEGHFHIEVDLPGVAIADLEVTIHEDLLTIKARRQVEEGRQYAYNGRTFSQFERSLRLPESVEADSVDARLANGVLHLTLRKRAEAQVKKIEVRQD
jgi:HSP20 family protein